MSCGVVICIILGFFCWPFWILAIVFAVADRK